MNDNVFKMSKDEKYTCKVCKNTVVHCQIFKFVEFLMPSSSWLLKLPFDTSGRFRGRDEGTLGAVLFSFFFGRHVLYLPVH